MPLVRLLCWDLGGLVRAKSVRCLNLKELREFVSQFCSFGPRLAGSNIIL
jgi:hypothetical protein